MMWTRNTSWLILMCVMVFAWNPNIIEAKRLRDPQTNYRKDLDADYIYNPGDQNGKPDNSSDSNGGSQKPPPKSESGEEASPPKIIDDDDDDDDDDDTGDNPPRQEDDSDPQNNIIIKANPTRAPEDYDISTTLEPSPMVYFSGQLSYDQECSAYGDEINVVQKSTQLVDEKKKKLKQDDAIAYFGTKICNWAKARVECIVDDQRVTTTTPPPGTEPVEPKKLKGKCKCLLAMGEKAIWIKNDDDEKKSKCYIPADFGHHSNCDHDVTLPYGEIDETVKVKRIVGSAGSMCVPQSTCSTGYHYIGFRCHCKKNTKHDRKTGTCSNSHKLIFAIDLWIICSVFYALYLIINF